MDTALQAQQEALIGQEMARRLAPCTRREEMSRAAAALLFFDFGIYPSAKTVYKYIKRGSVTDINTDLRAFWKELRARSKTQLNTPSLPPAVAERFSDALSEIWELCLAQANASLDAARAELTASKLEAKAQVLQANVRADELEKAIAALQARQEQLHAALRESESSASALGMRVENLQGALTAEKADLALEKAAHQGAIAHHLQELTRERNDRKFEAERFEGEVKFAKLQIDQARAGERLLKEQLEEQRKQFTSEIAVYRIRASRAEEEIGRVRLELAEAQGRLATLSSRRPALKSHASARPAGVPRRKVQR